MIKTWIITIGAIRFQRQDLIVVWTCVAKSFFFREISRFRATTLTAGVAKFSRRTYLSRMALGEKARLLSTTCRFTTARNEILSKLRSGLKVLWAAQVLFATQSYITVWPGHFLSISRTTYTWRTLHLLAPVPLVFSSISCEMSLLTQLSRVTFLSVLGRLVIVLSTRKVVLPSART